MRRDRAVVDDAAAPRLLALHDLDRFLRAQEGTGEIRVDHGFPLFDGEVLERHRWGAGSRVVEEQIEPAKGFLRAGEERLDQRRVRDVGGHHE